MKTTADGQGTTGGIEATLGYAVKQLHHALRAAVEHRLRRRGIDLSFPHGAALYLLQRTPGLSGAELARWAMVTPQTMQHILARLERDGLVVRRRDARHGRILRAYVTARGRRRFDLCRDVAESVFAEVQAGLGANQRDRLMTLLRHCLGNVQRLAAQERRLDPTAIQLGDGDGAPEATATRQDGSPRRGLRTPARATPRRAAPIAAAASARARAPRKRAPR